MDVKRILKRTIHRDTNDLLGGSTLAPFEGMNSEARISLNVQNNSYGSMLS